MTQRRPNFGPIVYARAARPPGSTGLSAELRRQAGCPASSWSAPSTLTSTLTRPTVVKPASEILVKDHGGECTVESARWRAHGGERTAVAVGTDSVPPEVF